MISASRCSGAIAVSGTTEILSVPENVMSILEGRELTTSLIAEASKTLAESGLNFGNDYRYSVEYRRKIAGIFLSDGLLGILGGGNEANI